MPPLREDASASLLHMYRLQRHKCRKIPACSSLHPNAELRIKPEDLERLRNTTAGDDYMPIICLFSTGQSNMPVTLQTAETIYINLNKSAKVFKQRRQLQQSMIETPEHSNVANASLEEQGWQRLYVSASQAYVRGLRVSGVVHRSVVRLVRQA